MPEQHDSLEHLVLTFEEDDEIDSDISVDAPEAWHSVWWHELIVDGEIWIYSDGA